ncbi:hypothetical protein MTBBW1_50019 [Desulfamplus magnetovallimortis]|uniref:Uncharacterized protein n=1 Tax=Desulfamplus magnetovallimortis TaxID=1246637 RepID=A0A1W1HHH4_9BACT|nr:hypothetical protein MTBBW1_50019 [Desulfamplus magnetovallimortis]
MAGEGEKGKVISGSFLKYQKIRLKNEIYFKKDNSTYFYHHNFLSSSTVSRRDF